MKPAYIAPFIIVATLTILMCWQESRKRNISFITALVLCLLLTPVIGYIIISMRPRRNAIGCKWCGNTENEAVFCGICGKDWDGNLREMREPQKSAVARQEW